MRGWQRRWRRTTVGATMGLALIGGLLGTTGKPAVAEPSAGQPSPASARIASAAVRAVPAGITKTDKVKAPKVKWYRCYRIASCSTVKLPLDYDRPTGKKVEIALLKISARKPKKRIGSLFVNPGGPGGSATELAYYSRLVFSPQILDRFDIVGMDPRGIGFSDNVKCFPDARRQASADKGLDRAFPTTAKERKAWIRSLKKVGSSCSKDKLATSMSTAQVARDMEMIRRSLKEPKLNYVGFSYGTYLGQVYANMYPKRFRAMVIDGVIDGRAWAGTTAARRRQPLEARLDAGVGADRAFRKILALCDQAGPDECALAPNATGTYNRLAARLKAKPLVLEGLDGKKFTYGYSDLVGELLSALYDPSGWSYVEGIIAELSDLAFPSPDADPADRTSSQAASVKRLEALRKEVAAVGGPTRGFPYNNDYEAFASVTCTDSRENTKTGSYRSWEKKVDPIFGLVWLWSSSICAADAFKGNDEDAYRGPFDRRTKATVLVVGDLYDPATNLAGAQSVAKEMPNARLLRSDTFGHTAYGVTPCVTNAVDRYLLTGKAAKSYAVCANVDVPFATNPDDVEKAHARAKIMAKLRGGRMSLVN